MLPITLFPEGLVRGSGTGPGLPLGKGRGKTLELRLSISRMMERQTLDIIIWGSADGVDYGSRPLMRLPHRYYCGTYHTLLDLSDAPAIRFLQLEYRLQNWARIELEAVASFNMTAETVQAGVLVETAVG